MKNINENISRVKSIMGLLIENKVIQVDAKDSDYVYILDDGTFYSRLKGSSTPWVKYEVTDENEVKLIKEKYITNSLTVDSPTNFGSNLLKFWNIFLRDYKSFFDDQEIHFNEDGLLSYADIWTKQDDLYIHWVFEGDKIHVTTAKDTFTAKIEDNKIVLTDTKFSDLKNPDNLDRPNTEKKGINPSEEYIKFNAFSAIADDIYRDLIDDKISNVSFEWMGNVKYNSNDVLDNIYFGIKIDGKRGVIEFNENGVVLKVDDVQVKPIWTDKILKYRPFNVTENKTGNEWMKSQVELSLDEQFKLLKKQFQELYLL